MEHTFWIWYPGDFEIYHGMLQNFSRGGERLYLAGILSPG